MPYLREGLTKSIQLSMTSFSKHPLILWSSLEDPDQSVLPSLQYHQHFQLTCFACVCEKSPDSQDGENEVPSEDALILQLHLAKGHEKFTEMLKSQQQIIVDLQQKLAEQQHILVSQQREILEQQRKMYEQMDLIKVQYGMLFDTVKQMSFQSLQEDIQNYFESHLQGLQNQDRDECTESPSICGERIKCLNTPGGFRCLGIAEKDAALGMCGEEYFFNKEMKECQACLKCEDGMVAMPCSTVSDTVCSATSENKLSESWAADIILPSVKSGISQVYSGLNLKIKAKLPCEILSIEDNSLVFRQHGLLWTDLNFAVKHNCRNFLQLSLKLNGSEEGYELSGVRIEQPEGKWDLSVHCRRKVHYATSPRKGSFIGPVSGNPLHRHCAEAVSWFL
ncbi:PREDICTED: uncharacterized protein LOC104076360 [Fulmarus glacialis]|uniref:uncharacterized protein LOC104076360 n=1 Tax=Fulmarus glacialis TaxID=30455 RepID=UPI00051C1F50|nr:PREDICTED: uncharacterized protein LOC104076360 [Fulmarus glacialis]